MSAPANIQYFPTLPSWPKIVSFFDGKERFHRRSGWAFVEYHEGGVVKRRCKAYDGFLPIERGAVYEELDETGYVQFNILGSEVLRYRRSLDVEESNDALEEAEAIKRWKLARGYEVRTKPKKTNSPNRGRPRKSTNRG